MLFIEVKKKFALE